MGLRVTAADDLRALLERAFATKRPTLVECPIDYSENEAVWNRELDQLQCPLF